MPHKVVKNPRAQKSEKPKVLNMNSPKRRKKVILANNRKHDAEHEVIAPEVTEIPT